MVCRHGHLHEVRGEAVGDEVEESVDSCPLTVLPLLNDLVRVGSARPDGHTEDDAEADSEEGGDRVVEDSPASNLPTQSEVQLANGGNQTGNNQGDDETLQHVEEYFARVAEVVGLSGSVDAIANTLQGEAQ